MKKTNIIIFILVITFICLTVGCREQIQPAEANNSILEEVAVEMSVDDYRYFCVCPDGRYCAHPLNTAIRPLHWLKNDYPDLSTYRVGQDALYTVFKLNDEYIGDYYAYVFCHSEPRENDEDRFWWAAGLLIRISKHLSQNDFSCITIGSSISDVEAVDPATFLSIPLYYYNVSHDEIFDELIGREIKVWGRDFSLLFDTFHYTDDGILRITFSRETIYDEFKVSEIELNSTFEVDPYDGIDSNEGTIDYEGKYPPIELKINPEHIPN